MEDGYDLPSLLAQQDGFGGSSGTTAASGGGSWTDNWNKLLQYGGKTAVDLWAQTNLMQQAQTGQQYLEGQRMQQAMMQQRLTTGGIPPIYLMLAAGAFFLLRK